MKTAHSISMALLVATVISMPVKAAPLPDIQGSISQIRAHDSFFESNSNWIKLANVKSAGSCSTHEGLVLLKIKDDVQGNRQFSLAMAAKLANKPVVIHVNDDHQYRDKQGFCYLRSIDLF